MVELTPGMRAVTATFVFTGTLENGGFVACMQGLAGDFTAEAILAAKLIGADGHATVIEEFVRLALLGNSSMDGEARERRADEMTQVAASAAITRTESLAASLNSSPLWRQGSNVGLPEFGCLTVAADGRAQTCRVGV
jgi:Domain of unknown function (DUF4375)